MLSFVAWPRSLLLFTFSTLAFNLHVAHARQDTLYTNSVSYCTPPENILIQEFSVQYFASNQSVNFDIVAASVTPNLSVSANVLVNVYGMHPVNLSVNFCDAFGKALCPLPTITFNGTSSIQLPSSVQNKVGSALPDIAYKIPDLEAVVQLTLTDISTGKPAACLQATLSNGWSTRQTAVQWTTGLFTLFAFFSSAVHSLKPTTPWSPASPTPVHSLAPARFVDLVLLAQQIALTGLLHLNMPLAYRAFTANFGWALGLFPESQPIQRAIDRMRHLTGGDLPDGVLGPTTFVNRELSPYNFADSAAVLAQMKSLFATAHGLVARDGSTDASQGAPATVTSAQANVLPAGIPVYVNSLEIGTANAFMSVFFSVLIAFVVGAGALGLMYVALTFAVTRLRGNRWAWADVVHSEFRYFAASNGIRFALIILYPVIVFSFFQWTLHDSWLAILLSVILLLATGAGILYPIWRTFMVTRRESREALYTDLVNPRTIGALYIQFRMERFYFFCVPLVAAFLKALFISFGQNDGLAQVVGLLLVELAVLALHIIQKPNRARSGDVLGTYLAVTRVASIALLIPFVERLAVKPIPRVAVGFVLSAALSIAFLVLAGSVVWNFLDGLVYHRRGTTLRSTTDSDSHRDVEKLASEIALGRPINPTPSDSHSRVPSSRHAPDMAAAVSPNFTIPTFYTEDSEEVSPRIPSPPSTGARSSYFTASPSSSEFRGHERFSAMGADMLPDARRHETR